MTDFRFTDYDASYPPSILNPPTDGWATTATAGIPGTWGPPGSTPPPGWPSAAMSAVTAIPATPWTAGQYMQTGTAGTAGRVAWSGTGWVGGVAPGTTFEPGDHTIDDVKAYIEALTEDIIEETQRVLDAERAGQARVTLLAWLDARPGVV